MKPIEIQFTPQSSKGEHPQTSGARFVNAIGEQIEDGRLLIKRAPGLTPFAESENKHCRGMVLLNNSQAIVVKDDAVEVLTGSDLQKGGRISGSEIVSLARNNAVVPDIVCVANSNAYLIATDGKVTEYPDSDVGSPIDVFFTGGYFFFVYGDGTCRATGLNSTSINTLDVIKAESRARGLMRGVPHRGQAFLFGPASIEVWSLDNPNAVGFPANRLTVIETGLMSRRAVTGFEDEFTSALLWAAPTCHINMLDGYSPRKISTPTIERDLQSLQSAGRQKELNAFSFAHQGHAYVVFKCADWTHVYDMSTSTWQERASWNMPHWRGENALFFGGHWLIGDETTGTLFRVDHESSFEGSDPVVFDVESVYSDMFPIRKAVRRVDFNFAMATAKDAGEIVSPAQDPRVLISWSDDGGKRWSRPVERRLGRIGQYSKTVTINGCGVMGGNGRKWRVQVADPGFVGLMGATMWVDD